MTIKTVGYIALSVSIFMGSCLFAQEKKGKGVIKTSHPVSNSKNKKDSIRVVLLPEFFHPGKTTKNDTDYSSEVADFRDNIITNIDTLHSINEVEHIFLLKSYFDRSHGNGDGVIGPPYYVDKIKIFVKLDPDTWLYRNLEKGTRSQLTENRKVIVRRDTSVIALPQTGNRLLTIRNYYKLTEGFLEPDKDEDHAH